MSRSMSRRRRHRANGFVRRYVAFFLSLFVIALGVSLSLRANLGSSPISCPPYVLSLVPGAKLSVGQYTVCMHVFFITAQILLLRKNYQKIQLLQILVGFVFGFYTDLTMWLTQPLVWDSSAFGYAMRAFQLVVGCSVLALGIALEVRCRALMLAGEGFPSAVSKAFHSDFGRTKIFTDSLLVAVGAAFCIYHFGTWRWDLIGPGTLFAMFVVGMLVRRFSRHLRWFDHWLFAVPRHVAVRHAG